jgi:phage shock protein C
VPLKESIFLAAGCHACGSQLPSEELEDTIMNNSLMRSQSDRMIGGVCGGLAAYFGIDSAIVRLIFVVAVLSGVSPLVYLVLWIVMPEQSASTTTALPEHPRRPEEWKYDPVTGERIER